MAEPRCPPRVYDRGVRTRRSTSLAAILGALVIAGCEGTGPLQIYVPPDDAGASTGGAGASSMSGGSGGFSMGGSDAGISPVLVAITPTPATNGAEPTAADDLEADLATFGAGARAAIVIVPWSALPSGEDPGLAKRIAFYEANEKRVLVNLAIVDRLADQRPAAIKGTAWNSAASLDAAHQAIDTIFEAGGPTIRFLTFARDADVYLAAHPAERSAFVSFIKDACAYAKGHSSAAVDFAAGGALSSAAPKSEPSFADLLDAGDVIAFSHLPGLGTYETDATSNVVTEIGSLADAAGSKPIVLQAAGAPTDGLAGGSEAAQQTYFSTLFGAVGARRPSFALLDVTELSDAPPATCAAWAVSQGEPADGAMAAYACSLGVWSSDGAPKPAWSAVIAGAAALSSP